MKYQNQDQENARGNFSTSTAKLVQPLKKPFDIIQNQSKFFSNIFRNPNGTYILS